MMTILAVAAIKKTTLDEKIAGNLRVQNIAFQAAEQALRKCESALTLASDNPNEMCLPRPQSGAAIPINEPAGELGASPQANFPHRWELASNWENSALAYRLTGSDKVSGLASEKQPQCMIETWPFNDTDTDDRSKQEKKAYVITARAVGPTNAGVVWLQEVIRCGN
ncbi:MAG: hypothetical protein K2P84_02085 [Undibacterium sp.]|nr:hypothetical protein [Undibacterium sp.]